TALGARRCRSRGGGGVARPEPTRRAWRPRPLRPSAGERAAAAAAARARRECRRGTSGRSSRRGGRRGRRGGNSTHCRLPQLVCSFVLTVGGRGSSTRTILGPFPRGSSVAADEN